MLTRCLANQSIRSALILHQPMRFRHGNGLLWASLCRWYPLRQQRVQSGHFVVPYLLLGQHIEVFRAKTYSLPVSPPDRRRRLRTQSNKRKSQQLCEVFLFMTGIYSYQIIAHPFPAAASSIPTVSSPSPFHQPHPFFTDPPLVLPNS